MNHHELASLFLTRPWAIENAAGAALCLEVARGMARGDLAADAAGEPPPRLSCEPYFAAIPGQTAAAVARREGRVAVLPIRGTIMPRASYYGAGLEQISKAFIGLRDDAAVKAIVLDIDSLGGSVEGMPEFGTLLREGRDAKPVVAQVSHRAASAGYWIAAQGSEVAVSPSGDVGSVGVITLHANFAKAYEGMGIDVTVMTSTGAPFKAEGHPFGPLSDETKSSIQSDLDAFESMFHDAVAEGRGAKVADVKANSGQGRMVLAEEAVKRGMADRVATLEQTLNRFGASLYGTAGRRAETPSKRIAARHFLRTVDLPRD